MDRGVGGVLDGAVQVRRGLHGGRGRAVAGTRRPAGVHGGEGHGGLRPAVAAVPVSPDGAEDTRRVAASARIAVVLVSKLTKRPGRLANVMKGGGRGSSSFPCSWSGKAVVSALRKIGVKAALDKGQVPAGWMHAAIGARRAWKPGCDVGRKYMEGEEWVRVATPESCRIEKIRII